MDLLKQIKDAGIIGCGGAGFPTYAKLDCQVEFLLINAAECEPLLRTDRYLMRHRPKDLLRAVEAAGNLTGAQRMLIGLKKTYTEEIRSLEEAIRQTDSPVRLHRLSNYYPAGDEQALVCDITGRTVPPGGIPLNVGAVVSNAASMIAVSDAMDGVPFTDKYLTVTGEVNHPVIVKAPIGTDIASCIEAAGGARCPDYHILIGGPMMGALHPKEALDKLYVTKTTSGVILVKNDSRLVHSREFPLSQAVRMAKVSCIQCQTCTEMCPRFLTGHPLAPHKIMCAAAYSDPEHMEEMLAIPSVREALTCSECGLCEVYACPMGLSPRKVNQWLKAEYRKRSIRYERTQDTFTQREEREYRRVNSHRLAMRLDVEAYYDYDIDTLIEVTPSEVHISTAQQIGAPSEIAVSVGDTVSRGTLIGRIPENALSANTHSSIDGKVTGIDGSVVHIQRV